MKLKQFIFALVAMLSSFAFTANAQVAKVGNTEYAIIDEAIAAWTNGTTLTLLADVTLSKTIELSSTEYHILDLGTYTMTAASRKDAIQIVNNGRTSASYALDIKADATNPGGITASGKAVVKTTGKSGVKDRPIIRFYGGVLTGTNVVYHSGSNGTNCPQFWFYGGEFNGTIYANRALFQFYGGTFNGALQISVDSSAYALVSGGKFKKLSNQYGSALNSDKFTIGSAKGNYNRGIYVDAEGYYVVTSEVITEVSAKYPAVKKESYNSNNYFYYSAAATYGMFYEVASMAGTGSNVTVWEGAKVAEELEKNDAFEYTPQLPTEVKTFEVEVADVVIENEVTTKVVFTVTPSNAEGNKVSSPASAITFRLPVPAAWAGKQVYVSHDGTRLNGTYTVQPGNYVEVTSASFSEFAVEPVPPVAKIGDTEYATLIAAVAAVQDGETITLIADEIFTATNYTDNGGWRDGLGYAGDKSFTIDLNGFTVSQDGSLNDYLFWFKNTGSKANTITIKNGTLDAGTTAYCALCTASSHDNQLTINTEDLNLINNISNGSTVKVRAGSVLNVKEGTKITGKNSYLGIENWNATVNIYDGAEIYMNGTASYNGCLVGVGGGGTVNVYGGYGKGVKGGFIAMTSGGTINVAGGEWIANTDGTIGDNSNYYVLTAQSNKYESGFAGASIINVTGGTLRGGMDAWVLNNIAGEKAELNITGGNFNANPSRFVKEGYLATVDNGIYTVAQAAAKAGDVYYATLNEAFAAATEGATITLFADATPALTSQRAITKAAVIDLGGKTLTLTEDDLYFGTTKFQNGTIVVDPSVKPSTAVFWMFANQTLTFDNVKLVATGVTGTYLIGLDGNNSDLNIINGSEIVVENTTALDLDIICVNASTGNDILVENSKVNVSNLDGRVFFRGNYIVKDSEVALAGITKAGFRIEAGQTLSIEGNSTVTIEGEPRDGGIHLTDLTATYTKAETATVTSTLNEVAPAATIDAQKFATLQAAVNAVQNGQTIVLGSDLTENVTLTEKTGLYYTIDGNGNKMNGTITISSLSDTNDNRRITIKGINFVTSEGRDFITSTATNHYPRLTVEGCSFTGTGKEAANTVAIRLKSSHSVVIKDCTGTGLHSFLQNTAGWNLTIENVKVTDSKSGLALGTVQGVTVKGSEIAVDGYGIRLDAGYNNNAVIETNKVTAFIPVVVRKAEVESNITFNGTNNFDESNTDGIWCAIGTSEYETNGEMPTAATGKVRVTLNDTGVAAAGVYGAYVPVAKIGEVEYTSLEAAFKAATSGCTIEILDNVTVDQAWDCRYTGSKFTVPVTINGNGKTIKFTASVNDNNYQAPFRFEADATVNDLTIDMSEVTDNRFRAISSKGNLTVDGCKFIGKDESLNCRAIIFGEGAGTNVGNLAIAITNSEFINWKRGITDNENGQDVKTATITGNTLENAAVYVSAYENVTFTGNTVEGAYVDIRSYTANSSLNVTATGNTLEENTDTAYNYIKATGNIDQEGFKVYAVAKIGDVEYTTIEKAYAALQEGDEIVILKKGSYALKVKNNVTITGAVDGVEFANIGAFGCGGANVTFNNVTFTYAANSTYNGLQHSGNLVYNNCIFNGQVFLYGQSETFNKCTFVNTGDNYNVWTYGAANVAFNECTFSCDGKSVLVYTEGANTYNNVSVTKCQFNAAQAVVGKAAIEMDSSLSAGINLTIDGETTATGFGNGNVSGNSLWNNKKGQETEANNDITVTVGDEVVLKPIVLSLAGEGTEVNPYLINNVEELLWFQAKVDEQAADGSTQYAGKYIKLTADIDLEGINWNPIGSMTGDHGSFKGVFDGDNHTISNLKIEQDGNGLGLFAYTSGNAVIKNLNLDNVTVKSTNNSNYVGGVVGNAYASTKIENVHVTGDVLISGRGYIGGIAGHGYVVMDNVSVVANEGGLITSTFWCAGGVLGYAGEGTTNIKNAHVEGLTVTSAAGGLGAIVGMAEDNNGTQPISGSNLSAKNVAIKTYVGDYGTSYADYALGYLYGGNETSKLTGDLVVENVTVETSSGVAPTIVDAVATVGDAVYFDFAAAMANANEGKTVKLFKDVVVAETFAPNGKTFTLDGNGKTISQAANCTNTYALFDITGGEVTIKNVTFDGVKGGAVVRTVDTKFAMDNVIAQNCEHTQQQGLFRLLGENTITNSTFKNNKCSMVMTINYDGASDTPQVVDNCLFEGNTVNGTAALYYVKGASFALTNSEFVNNTVNCNSNGATIYLGFQENCTVTGNLFQDNVVADASSSTRVAGAIFFGYAANISGNVFVNNTASNAAGSVLGQVCASTYYNCTIDLGKNYWGGEAPAYGKDYTLQHQTGEGAFALDNYYTSYEVNEAGNLVFGETATINYAAKAGKLGYATIKDAVAAVKEGETITILAGTHSEGTIKLPATLKNVTIKGASAARSTEGAVLKDMTISAADGNSYSYVNLTFDGITFDNSRLLFTGWRNGEEVIENLTVTNCTFKNLNDDTNTAPVHINKDASEAVNGFTFTNNVIDGATGGQKSGIYAQVTGDVVVSGNEINNVSFRPYVIQVTTDDGIADNFTVTGNTFSGSAVGRAQGLGNNAEGTDDVNLVVSNNIFKGITGSQQICYWNFNAAKTTADLSGNYYDIDILANPGKIYYNSAAESSVDLIAKNIFPIYTELNEDGTINLESAYRLKGGIWGGIDWTLTDDGVLTIAPTKGTPVADKNAASRTYEVGQWREAVKYDKSGEGVAIEGWPYDCSKVKTLIIEEGVTSIGSFAAQSMTNLTGEVVIPSTVKYIGQEAFQKSTMTKLTFAAVPAGETGEELCIAQGAFKNLIIEEIEFPNDRPVHLHAWVLNNCHNLKNVTFPATLVGVHGTNHIDYFKDFNAHSNPTWTKSSEILAYNEKIETVTFESEEARDLFYSYDNNTSDKDYIVATVGLTSYGKIADAIAAVNENGGTIKMHGNVTLTDTWTIPAGKTITLDLNGKTISQSKACTASYEMINNKGNLNIVGSGKISFTDTSAGDSSFGWGSYTVRNEGNLVVEKATIEHKGAQAFGTHCIMAIYQYSGSTTINGGTISTPNYRSARLWKGEMTINGGTFDGQVWVQAVDNSANLVINGGTFAPRGNDGSSVFVTNSTYDVAFAVTDGTFEGKIGCSNADKLAGAITGGTFSATAKENTAAALIATGYVFGEVDANGYYTIVDDPDTHYINNVEEFVAFRDAVNAGNDFAGVAVYLTADIDLTGIDWSVNIGDDCSATFDGTFDGQGHTIKNLTSTETAQKGDGYICTGLFGAIHGGAVLKNFTVENVAINTGDFTGNNVAAVVGFAYQATGSIENVKVTGDININAAKAVGVGAIIGYDYYSPALEVKNCVVSGNGGSAIVGKSYVGGAVGYASSKIALNNNTVENVSVTATGSVGALAGIMLSGSSATDNTVKNVALTATGELWANSAAVVAGTITSGGVTVANTTVENVTANGVAAALVGGQLVEKPTAPIAKVEAKIGDKYYTTLDAALATQGEATVELLVPVTVAAGESRVIELNGKTITATDNATGSYAMITNKGNLTINGEGAIKLTATINRGWNAYSSVISNTVGGKLTVNGGTIEHLGGTDMAYAIDNLTNGKGTYAETVINGGTVKSTYRAVRQFLNGVEAQNILTVNGGTIEGANKSIWMQDPSKNANTGTLTVAADAVLKGDVYLFVTAGSTEWPVEVAIANAAFATGTVVTGNVPAQYAVANVNGVWSNVSAVAAIDGVGYATLAAAVAAAKAGDTITLLQDVEESVTISKNLSIDGAGNTITGMITTDGKSLKVTIKNVNFDGNNKTVNYAMRADDDLNLVVENCSVKDYLYGFLYANKSNDKIVVKNVTVENCAEYGAYLVSFNKATFENFVVNGATKYGIAVANAAARNVTLKNVSFENAETPLSINEIGTGKVTFTFEGVNDMSKAEFYTSKYVVVVAEAQAGTKVCGSLQDAIAAAETGETVKLLNDFVMNTAAVTSQVDGYAVLVNVKDKAITIDLNGKKVTVNASADELAGAKGSMLMAVFHADPNSELILTDSSDDATGTVELIANDAKVYSFIVSENAGDKTKSGKIVVNGGNYIADKLSDSMIYADTDEVITVNGGNFHLDNTGTSTNGKPWIFNTLGANQIQVLVNGGTYNTNIGEQYYRDEFKLGNVLTIRDNKDGTWSVVTGVTLVDGEFTEYTNDKTQEVEYISYTRKSIPTTWTPFYVPFEVDVEQLADQGFEVAYINGVRRDDKNYDGELDEFVMEIIYIHSQEEDKVDGSSKTLKANYPYFIRSYGDQRIDLNIVLEDAMLYAATDATYDCTTMTEQFEFIGNLSKVTIKASDDTALRYVVSGGKWSKRTIDSELNPFRFSMELTSRNGSHPTIDAPAMMSIAVRGELREDGTTFIYDIEMDAQQTVDYIYDLQGRRVLEPEKGNLYIINGKKVIF